MSQLFSLPLQQIFSSTPEVLNGAKLFFYESGTSTKLDTYSDEDLTSANSNPVVLDSSGRFPSLIFLQNQKYKVVIAPKTDSDPPTSPIWTADPVSTTDFESVQILKTGSGAPTGVVAGTAGSAGVIATAYLDYTSNIYYVCSTTGDAASAGWTAINASAATPSVPPPQGYLTLVTGTPVITSDQASKTTVYYTPDKGNLIPIYNGSSFTPTTFSELSLTLVASHVASTIYDIFVWSESGVVTLGTGPAWSVSTAGSGARGTGASTTELTRVQGFLVNAVSMTTRNGNTTYTVGANLATYVGSIFMDGTNGEVTCHRSFGQSRKFGLWNAYNRRLIVLRAGDGTASWSYITNTIRSSNNDATNSLTTFCGLAEELIDINFTQNIHVVSDNSTIVEGIAGIGFNSTSAMSGKRGKGASIGDIAFGGDNYYDVMAEYTPAPSLGINTISALETAPQTGAGSAALTWFGGEDDMLLQARWMG